jgi:hypothetical protein
LEEILCGSDESVISDSSSRCGYIDNEIGVVHVGIIVNQDDNSDEENLVNEEFSWDCMSSYSGDREVFCGDCGCRNGAENVTHIVDCFELLFDKNIIQIII